MAAKRPAESYSDEEAEQRARNALLRALTTPYKPQSDLKIGRKPKKKSAAKTRPKSP